MNLKFLPALLLALLLLPARAQDYEAQVTDLIPKLADAAVGNRYAAEMQLQALASEAAKPGNEAARAALGKALAAKAADAAVPQPARVWVVRQLQYMGGAEAVPALTGLLKDSDVELRDCARRALEQNPAPAANSSLLEALKQASEPASKCALIHSLGQRREVTSVAALVPALKDAAAAPAAAEALGNIASPEAVQALQAAPDSAVVADALIAAAQRCQPAAAAAIYQQLFSGSKISSARAAALRGLAHTGPDAFAGLVQAAVASPDARLRDAAVDGCGVAPAGAAVLAKALPELPPAVRVRALNAVETWDFNTACDLTKDADAGVRAAAFAAVGRLSGAEVVQFLVKAAATGETADRASAQTALNGVKSPDALAELRLAAGAGDAAQRSVAMNALIARRDAGSLSLLVAALQDPQVTLRRPALAGLRQMGGAAEMEAVARFTASTGSPEAAAALLAMAGRVTEKPTAADQLLAAAGENLDAIAGLAESLAVLGGAPALNAVARAATSGQPEARATAIEALGDWPELTAAPTLLAIAGDPAAGAKLQSAALAAAARLVRSAEAAPLADREAALLPALALARQVTDRKLLLAALATVPTVPVGDALRALLSDPTVRSEAALAAVTVAEGLNNSDRVAARDLAQAVKAAAANRDALVRAERLLK
jgi:hypothetical protein